MWSSKQQRNDARIPSAPAFLACISVGSQPETDKVADPHTEFRQRIARIVHALDPVSTGSREAGDVTSLAFSRFCRTAKPNALAWLTGFRAGYYGAPYVWPLGTLDPQCWALGFIEGRGNRGQP